MAIIDSRNIWNNTGIHLEEGNFYQYVAIGTWNDASFLCDANGWSDFWRWGWANWAKRCPQANWFQLIGSIDRQSEPIVLGTSGSFVAPATGELCCYANDSLLAYGNNQGSIRLEIIEQPAPGLVQLGTQGGLYGQLGK